MQSWLNLILHWIDSKMGWGYMWMYVINFCFFGYLLVSKYGRIRFGQPHEKPAYSNFQWGSMVFATAIDASILMLSIVDPLRYLQHPPFGAKPYSQTAYDISHMYGQFNWGPMAWLMFASSTIAIGYVMYNKHRKVQSLSNAITVLDGDKLWKRLLRQFVDIVVVFGIMGGVGASVGLEIPVISKILSQLSGLKDTLGLKMALFAVLFVIFTVTVLKGLNGGINRLSNAHIWTAIIFLVIILVVGPTVYILNSETNSLGLLVQKFIHISTYTIPNGAPNVAQQETLFYWGWWLSYMPFMGLFIARISRGRTIRQVLIGMLTFGALGCMSFYAVLGAYSLWLQKTGVVNLVHILNTQGQSAVIAAVISTLPLKMIMFAIYCLSCFVFLATTISSSAYILSSFTSLPLKPSEEPSRFNRMTWVIIFIIFSFSLIVVGGFKTIQTFCTIAGFPILFIFPLLLLSIVRMLRKDPLVASPAVLKHLHRHHFSERIRRQRRHSDIRLRKWARTVTKK